MDWIGDKLAKLIEEGKRALGTEIVVSSEAPEDEVDDGRGDWIEDEEASASFAYESNRSVHADKPKRTQFSTAYSAPSSASAHCTSFSLSRTYSDDTSTAPSRSIPVMQSPSMALLDEGGISESPSIREAMEQARAAHRQRRRLNASA